MRKRIFTVLMALCSVLAIQAQTVRYVTENGEGDGKSWDTASGDIQAMIDELADLGNGEVWVAAGTYRPEKKLAEEYFDAFNSENIVSAIDEDKTFLMKKNVRVYGGFQKGATNLDDRDWEANKTILNGDLESYKVSHVVTAYGDLGSACLDGFTITGGAALTIEGGSTAVIGEFAMYRTRGGAVYAFRAVLTLNNLIVENNTGGLGGGIYSEQDVFLEIKNSIVRNNIATGNGGGLYFRVSTNASIKNIDVINNSATTSGSGLENGATTGRLSISDSRFTENAKHALCIRGATTISNSEIFNNQDIGIMHAGSKELVIENSKLYKNTSATYGGAINSTSTGLLSLANVEITDNNAASAAGLYNAAGSVYIEDCTVEGNTATKDGGGFTIRGTCPEIKVLNSTFHNNNAGTIGGAGSFASPTCDVFNWQNVTISENTAKTYGGGLSVAGTGVNYVFTNTYFMNNTAEGRGGAVDLVGTSVTSSMLNVVVTGNQATTTGGGINVAGYLTLINSSIAKNHNINASGAGGIHSTGTVDINNSIIYGNTSAETSKNIHPVIIKTTATYKGTFNHSLVEGVAKEHVDALADCNNNLDGTTIFTNDLFANFDAGDYTLLPWNSNPAINAGNNSFLSSTITKDLAGNNRTIGVVDLGAYEVQEIENPFEGTLNAANELEFTYSGSPAALTLKSSIGTAADYTWEDQNNTENTGSGLPTNVGVYNVTAAITAGAYSGRTASTTIRINKAPLTINFTAIPSMTTATAAYTLVATTTPETTDNIQFAITEGSSVTLNESKITPSAAGTTLITASLVDDSNYEYTAISRSAYVQDAGELDATILNVRVNGEEAVFADGIYTVTIPYATKANIEVIPNSEKATLSTESKQGEQDITLNGENTFTGKVVAFSGGASTEYTVKIIVQNNDASVKTVTLAEVEATEENGTYKVTIPFSDNAELVVTPTDANATVTLGATQQLGNLLPGTNQRSFTVTSQDKSVTTVYPLEIYMQSNNALLHTVEVNEVQATETVTEVDGKAVTTFTITIPYATTAAIEATALHAKAVVEGNTESLEIIEGENEVYTITVTAEDGTVETYELTITVQEKEKSADNSISKITVNGKEATLDGADYAVTVTSSTIAIVVETSDEFATVSTEGPATIADGTTETIVVTVTAENGSVTTYNLKVTVNIPVNEPDPIEYVVELKLPEGITLVEGKEKQKVEEGRPFTFSFELGDELDDQEIELWINDEQVTDFTREALRSSVVTYTVAKVTKDLTIEIKVAEGTVGNAELAEGKISVVVESGQLIVESGRPETVSVYSISGKLVARRIVNGTEYFTVPAGVYIVATKEIRMKVVVND